MGVRRDRPLPVSHLVHMATMLAELSARQWRPGLVEDSTPEGLLVGRERADQNGVHDNAAGIAARVAEGCRKGRNEKSWPRYSSPKRLQNRGGFRRTHADCRGLR